MTTLYLEILLIISKLVKIQNFIIITLIMLIIALYNKKIRKFIILLYSIYFLGIFTIFFPINKYGGDIITINFIKKRVTPDSFSWFKKDITSKEKIEEKILIVYKLSYDIKYQTKKIKEEFSSAEKELKNMKGIEKKFVPWTDTTNKF